MERVVEPELMEGEAQARAYAEADFSEPNGAFVARAEILVGALFDEARRVVDLGCGPADIPIRLARRHPRWRIDAVDGSRAMLAHARDAVRREGLEGRVRPVLAELTALPLPSAGYDLILSNSLLHHLHDPAVLWRAITRLGRPGAPVLVMDLARPADEPTARRLVDEHAAGAPEVLRRDFFHSLCAAFTPDEVRAQLAAAHLRDLQVERISDRHLTVSGRLPLPE